MFYAFLNLNIDCMYFLMGLGFNKSQQYKHSFVAVNKDQNKLTINAKKVLICVGVFTPYFLRDIMHFPYFVKNNYKTQSPKNCEHQTNLEYAIQEYVASYIHVKPQALKMWQNMPNYYNFLQENQNTHQYSAYGFRYHDWDTLDTGNKNFIKLGTMALNEFKTQIEQQQYLKNKAHYRQLPQTDKRVKAAVAFAKNRLNGVDPQDQNNKHFPCPIIFFSGRQTLLDYLQRNEESVVVQSGGWIGKYFPLLAKTAVQMLFQAQKIKDQRKDSTSVVGNFLNRTRFPIKPYIKDFLKQNRFKYPPSGEFKTVVVGAGCSGLYSAFRLHKANHTNIGVFQMSERISGRLKSFTFTGTTTPFQLGGMRYIAQKHILLNTVIGDLGIPSISFPMEGDPIQNHVRRAYLRNDYYQMGEWDSNQNNDHRLITAYRIKGHIVGMTAIQIISFSIYLILTAPENLSALTELFLQKTTKEIQQEKQVRKRQKKVLHAEIQYYKNWQNYISYSQKNPLDYKINLTLKQWNYLKPILVYRFPFEVKTKQVYLGQEKVDPNYLYPLYKFGFQNVIEAQFGHQAYQFVADQNGYFSNTSNASYLDQVMAYLLDFGDVTYSTLAGGFDNINYGMVNELLNNQSGVQTQGGGIFLGHKLVNIEHWKQDKQKYLLTFNYPLNLHKEEQQQNCLNLGKPTLLPDCKTYEVQLVADRVILGMPKRSIQLLYNQIQLFQSAITSYQEIYQKELQQYQKILQYQELNKQEHNIGSKDYQSLSPDQQEKRKKLLYTRNIQSFYIIVKI